MAAFLAFGSSGVAFAQDEPAVVADAIVVPDARAGEYPDSAYWAAGFIVPALLVGAGAVLLRRNNKKVN